MKIARYISQNKESYGIINRQQVVSLPALARRFKTNLPPKFEDFIVEGDYTLQKAEKLLKNTSLNDIANLLTPLSEVKLLAPISFPPKIICLGLNYFDHISETGSVFPDEPIIFMKPHTAIIGPNQKII